MEAKLKAESERVLTVAHLPERARVAASLPPPVQERGEEDHAPSKQEQRANLRRLYLQHRNAKKAAGLAGVVRQTAHRWLRADGLIGDHE